MKTFLAEGLVHQLREQGLGGFRAWCGWTNAYAVIDEGRIATCLECLASVEHLAEVGDVYQFEYPDSPQFNQALSVVQVVGNGPDDLVFFTDGTHSKQKHLAHVPRVTS